MEKSIFRTSRIAWGTLLYILCVILWGAYVRASGSGAGCGSHWPLCNGQMIPQSASMKTWIEFTHRITSGLSLVACSVLFWSAFRFYPKGSYTRKGATASLIMILVEAALGAGLVLLELVAGNKSVLRTLSLGIHLLSTFFLVAAVLLTAQWASQESKYTLSFRSIRVYPKLAFFSVLSVLNLLLLGSSGAMTALGDTLYPSLPANHFLIQLRVFHPVFAIGATVYIFVFTFYLKKRFEKRNSKIALLSGLLAGIQLLQVLLGVANIYFLVPIGLQLTHLLFADFIWILLILTLSAVWQEPHSRISARNS